MIRIDGYAVDAAVSEEHALSGEATSYPVEDGEDFTDNFRILPVALSIDGVISDSPMADDVVTERARESGTPSEFGRARLEAIFNARQPIVVETHSKVYESMLMVDLVFPYDKDTGQALRFSARFSKFRIQTVNRTVVRVATPRARGKRDLGTKAPTLDKGPPSGFVDRDRKARRAQYDPEKGRYVDADTGRPLTDQEAQDWVDQNGGDPQYRSPRDVGPGAYPGAEGSGTADGPPTQQPGYWPERFPAQGGGAPPEDSESLKRLRRIGDD